MAPILLVLILIMIAVALSVKRDRPPASRAAPSCGIELTIEPDVDFPSAGIDGLTPIDVELVRPIPGSDRPDYWLARLARPLRLRRATGDVAVTHVIVFAAWKQASLGPDVQRVPIGMALVLDPSVLCDATLEFDKTLLLAHPTFGTASARVQVGAPPWRKLLARWLPKLRRA